jgi:hypothetical protein
VIAAGRWLANPGKEMLMDSSVVAPFVGSWTYRSFVNNPDPSVDFNAIRFGQGELVIEGFAPGGFTGSLVFAEGIQLNLTGASSFGNPFALRFQGTGDSGPVAGWIYDYVGYFVPAWPNGVNQRPVIVGSTVRTVPHDGAAAGFVGTWFAIKRD